MKLINCKEENGDVKYINPMYVKTVKGTHSEYNNDWCIVIEIDSESSPIHTILFKSQEEYEKNFAEIINSLESIK